MRGIVGLPIVVGVVVILALFFVAGSYFKDKKPANPPAGGQQGSAPSGAGQGHKEEFKGGYGQTKPFYSKDGISLQHYWPGEASFSNEETEILLFNESNSSVQVKSFDLVYEVEGKAYPHKSGTWEKFPSKASWERIEYLNISPQYYKGEPLVFARGEKGKLHWHIQFGEKSLDGRQSVKVKLTLLNGGKTIDIDEELSRSSGAVFSKGEH